MATYTEIYLRRDSTLNWYATNPRLALGEPGIDLTLHRFKIGNGIDRWNELPYMDDDLYKLLDKQQQETADKVKDLLNKIAANKLDADTKHNALTTEVRNTSRELNTRMTAVEEEQAEYEESLTDEFTATKAEVHAGLEEFNDTRDKLTTRMDVIAGQATEATEILDARVDAEYQTHPNLGANIRHIHSEILSNRAQIAGLKANDELHEAELTAQVDRDIKLAEHGEFLQERLDETAEGLLKVGISLSGEIQHTKEQDKEITDLVSRLEAEQSKREHEDTRIREELHEQRKDFEHEAQSRQIRDEDLAGQVDELSGAVMSGQVYAARMTDSLASESRERQAAVENANEVAALRDEHLQEQADNNAEGLLRTEKILSEELRHSRQQDEEIAGLRAGLEAEAGTREELRRDFEHEAESFHARDEHLQEQADATAEAVIQETLSRHQDKRELHARDEQLQAEIAAGKYYGNVRDEHLQEQLDELAGEALGLRISAQREADERIQVDEHLQEQADDNAEAVLKLSMFIDRALKEQKSPVNWSSAKSLAIPEPRCAIVNFSGLTTMPTSKTADIPAVLEFWDMQGNYFKKNIVCSAQGSSSLGYVKKNVKVDLLNDDGSEFNLKIGNWVTQDGFHLKAFYTDFFRGVGIVSYKFWDEIMKFNGLDKDRPYKRVMIDASKISTSGTAMNNPDDLTLQMDTGALCHPDAFPCIVYLNGEFYGVFAWQIKKQRKNYRMDKSTVEHIHLDGTLYTQYFWDGAINWTTFEIRNPNKLYTIDGKKYDGDHPKELIDETSEKYDPYNKDHVRSAKVKKYIQDFVRRFGELKKTPTREKYDELFDWENQRDYLIFSDVIKNSDGFGKNWQWTTYDGVKWYVNAYDLDMSFGGHWQGIEITPPLTGHINTNTALPPFYVMRFYNTELEARYKELRDAGIISVSNILDKLVDWTSRVGTDKYTLEYERWPDSPCIVNYTDSLHRVKKWLEINIANMDRVYHYEPLTLAAIQENHKADIESLRRSSEGLGNIRQIYDEGLQEQIDQLAELRLTQILKEYQASKDQQVQAERERRRRQEEAEHLQAQADEVSEAVIQALVYDTREREGLATRILVIEEALAENEILTPASASLMTNAEVNNMIDNVLNGSDSSGIEPQDEDEAEIYNMLDDVFSGNDTGSYEDEITDDLDTIFHP